MLRVLVACEESQAVTIELRKLGIEAYSCDTEPCSGGHPEWHIQGDVSNVIKPHPTGNSYGYRPYINFITADGTYYVLENKWDMIIAFPPCTCLTVTGNRWFNIERYGEKAIKRHDDREKAIEFFMMFVNANCENIAIENPVGFMSTRFRRPDQIIHPYYFGDKERKSTCLWLKGLPALKHHIKNHVDPNIIKYKNGKGTDSKWHIDTMKLPPKQRSKARSKTFPGIAKAMAEQWGAAIVDNYFKEGKND